MLRAWGCLFRLGIVLVLVLSAYLYLQRIKIADQLIRRELYNAGVYDLDFTLSELSPFRFEMNDLVWGDQRDPFLYLSSVKVLYSPLRIVKGVLDNVEVGYMRTSVSLDEHNSPQCEAVTRIKALLQQYASSRNDPQLDALTQFELPSLELKRGRIAIRDHRDIEQGRLALSVRMKDLNAVVSCNIEYTLPGGRILVAKGSADLNFDKPLPSAIRSNLSGELQLKGLLPEELSLQPDILRLTGDLKVNNLSGQPEWSLHLENVEDDPRRRLEMKAGSVVSAMRMCADLQGTAVDLSGAAELSLPGPVLDIKEIPGEMIFSNQMDSLKLKIAMPRIKISEIAAAELSGSLALEGFDCDLARTLEIRELDFVNFFTLATNGYVNGRTDLKWDRFAVRGVEFKPMSPMILFAESVLKLRCGVITTKDDFSITFDAHLPLRTPHAARCAVKIPPLRIDNQSCIIRLIDPELVSDSEFSGTVQIDLAYDQRRSGSSLSGKFTLSDGSFIRDKVRVEGVSLDLPLAYDSGIRSRKRPRLAVRTLEIGNIIMMDGEAYFSVIDEKLSIESARIGWAGGFLHAYAIHAGFDEGVRILSEFTIYADRVNLGSVFELLMPFEGRMEGVLYGRFPVNLNGDRVELSTGYLYSLPGQNGYLRINDPSDMAMLLRRAGVSSDVDEIARALSDLDLNTIRLDLDPQDAENSSLRLRLTGRSNYARRPAPVDLSLNLNGPLEELLNLGLDLQRVKSR
jgi:hypothetical protein